MNQWNRDHRFARAYLLDKSRAPAITYEIQLQPFLPRQAIRQFVNVFDGVASQFADFLEGKPLEDDEPARPAPEDRTTTTTIAGLGIDVELIPQDDQGENMAAFVAGDPRPDSPAALARLTAGDTITRVNGKPILSPDDLQRLSGRVTIEFIGIRTRLKHTAEIEIPAPKSRESDQAPDEPARPAATPRGLGLLKLRQAVVHPPPPPPYRGDPRNQPIGPGAEPPIVGVEVLSVAPRSVAARAGIRPRDVIYLVEGEATIRDIPTLRRYIATAPGALHLWVLDQGVYKKAKEVNLHW
jgi:hypothetical protein